MKLSGGKSSVLQIFRAQKNFLGAASAQVASSNRVLTGMGWGVQRGGVGSGLKGKPPPPPPACQPQPQIRRKSLVFTDHQNKEPSNSPV